MSFPSKGVIGSYPGDQLSGLFQGDPLDERAEWWGVLLGLPDFGDGYCDNGVCVDSKGGFGVVLKLCKVVYIVYLPSIGSVGKDLGPFLIHPHVALGFA